jgi:ABC-2 type transport system permease protein
MKVAVVDEDATEESRAFAARLGASPSLLVSRLERDAAIDGVRRGTLTACVILKRGFSGATPFVSRDPAMEIGVDPARTAEAGYLQGLLMRGLLASVRDRLGDPRRMRAWAAQAGRAMESSSGIPPDQRELVATLIHDVETFAERADLELLSPGSAGSAMTIPIVPVTRQAKHPASAYQISFTQAVMWALFSCVLSFAVSIVQEREKGTLLRLRIAPVTRLHILGGKAAACAVSGIVVASGLMAVAGALFGLRFPAPHLLALALVCSVLCFTGIMMLLSVSGRTAQAVGGASSAVMLVLMMVGGGMIPLVVMPEWMQAIGTVSPVKWAVLAIEGAMWRQFTAAEMALPCGVLLAAAMVTFGIGAWRLASMDA